MTETGRNRLLKSKEYLYEAEFLYREKIGNLHVLTNLYHAMMNCLFALFDINNMGNLTHADIIKSFKENFIQEKIFPESFSEALDFAYTITHECDCEHIKQPSDSEIEKILIIVPRFIHNITSYLKKTDSAPTINLAHLS
jgi:uncharacterized protein (UPF0332 family)